MLPIPILDLHTFHNINLIFANLKVMRVVTNITSLILCHHAAYFLR